MAQPSADPALPLPGRFTNRPAQKERRLGKSASGSRRFPHLQQTQWGQAMSLTLFLGLFIGAILLLLALALHLSGLVAASNFEPWEKMFLGVCLLSIAFYLAALNMGLFALIAFVATSTMWRIWSPRDKRTVIFTVALLVGMAIGSPLVSPSHMPSSFGYWHSGNEDIFDGLYGAFEILSQNKQSWLSTFHAQAGTYLLGPGGAQYSTLALLASVHGRVPTMWDFLALGIIGMFGQFFATRYFMLRVFALSRRSSTAVALFATLSQFYFVTFLNGHIGTLMASPALIWLLAQIYLGDWRTRTGPMGVVLIYLGLTYPYYLVFVVIFAAHCSFSRLKGMYRHIIPFLFYTSVVVVSWLALSEQRIKSEDNFRSWGTIFTHLAPFQVAGLVPGQVAFSRLTYEFSLSLDRYRVPFYGLGAVVVALALASAAVGARRLARLGTQLTSLVGISLFLPAVIAFSSRDSYFTYKTLYSFYFVYVGIIAVGWRFSSRSPKLFFDLANVTAFALLIVVNGLYGTWQTKEIIQSNFNNRELAREAIALPLFLVDGSLPMLGGSPESSIYDYIAKVRGADLYSSPKRGVWISGTGAGKHYELRALPKDTMRFGTSGVGGLEASPDSTDFRWIFPSRIPGTDLTGVIVERLNPSDVDAKASVCVSSAPWLERETVINLVPLKEVRRTNPAKLSEVILWTRDGKTTLGEITAAQEISCKSFIIPRSIRTFALVSPFGIEPSIWDSRRIAYRVWNLNSAGDGIQ